ncbi:MAG: FAD-binding and (Fe-S)-binding domain-containing protein [Planctomycetia bacterium]|nr:FAD-binding and (Fe-S)-binding domain-containing protein [Planctomycetia bacterium]
MDESLSASRARLQEDLRGLIRGDVRCDDVVLQLYSSDGSPFEERPEGIVWPRSTQDVIAIMQYASEKRMSVSLRGSGTSGGCGSIGSGLVLDFSRYMRRVLYVGDDYARVQPGAIRERVNDQLRSTRGRIFGPNSGHVPTGTIGGVLSVDNIGPRWLRYGAPHENVLGLKVVSSFGELWDLTPIRTRNLSETVDPTRAARFRRQFLAAALADANDAALDSTPHSHVKPSFDVVFHSALCDYNHALRHDMGVDLRNGDGWRSFESQRVRAEFFKRAFGDESEKLRAYFRANPWVDALRAIYASDEYLDVEQRPNSPFRCGYGLRDVVRGGFDPTRLFVGAEGTLGAIVEATVATAAQPHSSGAVALLFDSLDAASRAVTTILQYNPTLCDLLDGRIIALTRDWDSRFETVFPPGCEAALVVEFDADNRQALAARMTELITIARERLGSFGQWTAYQEQERRLFRDLLRKSSCARLRMSPSFQYFPYWEDARVPVEALPDFLREIQTLFRREGLVYSVGGSVGCGSLSVQPIIPYSEEEERRAFVLSDEFEELVLRYHGEIGFSKGNGRVRTASIPKRYPQLFPAFVKIKDAFDPLNTLNPDCVVSPEMRRMAKERQERERDEKRGSTESNNASFDLQDDMLAPEADAILRESALQARGVRRRAPFDSQRLRQYQQTDWQTLSGRSQLEFQISWQPEQIYVSTYQCVGCGHCRIRTSETRMCPTFRHTPDESATCRAKANLLRGVLDGKLPLDTLIGDGSKKVADHCLQCYSCRTECPAQVDAARLAFRLKSAYNAANGLGVGEIFALRLPLLLTLATGIAPWINRLSRAPAWRWLLEKTFGVAQGRNLPLLERKPYLKRLERQDKSVGLESVLTEVDPASLTGTLAHARRRRRVALFIDTYANFFDAKLVEATLGVLEKNNIDARVITRPVSSGVIAFAIGDVDASQAHATRNLATLREVMRDGSDILTLEPSSAACILHEYPYFCNDDDARAVYANVTDVATYLARLHKLGELNADDMQPLRRDVDTTLGYHAPCRTLALTGEALWSPTPMQRLLELIPQTKVRRLERGCCGFANYTGFTRTRFSESLRLGARLYLAARNAEIDLCVSECSLCNLQLSQGVSKPIVHGLKALAVAYGVLSLEESYLQAVNANKNGRRWMAEPLKNR